MVELYYTGTGTRAASPRAVPSARYAYAIRPEGYRAEPGLVDAANVALLLSQPLLLTGEPGSGKTQFAASLAAELGLGQPFRFDTKSTSMARDLFYTVDTLGRFRAAQNNQGIVQAQHFMTYNALGLAILHANQPTAVQSLVPDDFVHPGVGRAVVLIDEIDKAPRDFPNDILAELEEMSFRIPELGNVKVAAADGMRPIVVMTSNSEKHLPDAFLRRVVYYHISFPKRAQLTQILAARLGEIAGSGSEFVQHAVDLFEELRRDTSGLRKKPATAELIAWITTLKNLAPESDDPLQEKPERALQTLGVLIKNLDDMSRARGLVEGWIKKQRP
jgi:MoxR-like ATPase